MYTNSLLPKNILVFELHVLSTPWEWKSLTKFQQVFLLLQEGLYFTGYSHKFIEMLQIIFSAEF